MARMHWLGILIVFGYAVALGCNIVEGIMRVLASCVEKLAMCAKLTVKV